MPMGAPNYEFLRFLNPYDPMFWMVVIYPEDIYKEPEEKPEYTYEDFLRVFNPEFYGLVGDEKKTMEPMYQAFSHMAIRLVNYQAVGHDEELWKFLVSMYIAHHMQMALGRLKNQADEVSMTPEKGKDKVIKYTFSSASEMNAEHFNNTNYGVAFWSTYSPYIKRRHWGMYTNWGFK